MLMWRGGGGYSFCPPAVRAWSTGSAAEAKFVTLSTIGDGQPGRQQAGRRAPFLPANQLPSVGELPIIALHQLPVFGRHVSRTGEEELADLIPPDSLVQLELELLETIERRLL